MSANCDVKSGLRTGNGLTVLAEAAYLKQLRHNFYSDQMSNTIIE